MCVVLALQLLYEGLLYPCIKLVDWKMQATHAERKDEEDYAAANYKQQREAGMSIDQTNEPMQM